MRTQSAGAGGGNPAATNSAGAAQPASGDAQVRKVTADVNNVEAAVAEANRLSGEADKYQKAIAVITLSATKNGSPSDNLQQLQSTVEAIDNTKLISKLNDVKKPLDGSSSGSLENTRNQDCNTLSQNAANQQQDVTDLTRCSAATSDASSALTTLSTAVSSLQEKLQTVSPYFGSQIAGLQGQLKPFSDPRFVATPPDASALLEVLSTALPPLQTRAPEPGSVQDGVERHQVGLRRPLDHCWNERCVRFNCSRSGQSPERSAVRHRRNHAQAGRLVQSNRSRDAIGLAGAR